MASARQGGESAGRWMGLLAGVAVAYILSVGPAIGLAERGWLPKRLVHALYRPFGVINGSPLEPVYVAYVRFWLPAPAPVDVPLNNPRF